MRRRTAKGVGDLRGSHARSLRSLGLDRWRGSSLEGLLLRSRLLLERLVLLAWEARELGLLRRRLLPEALRLSREACKLRLHGSLAKAGGLRAQSALEASWLLERLLLLAILGLAGPGTVAAP